MAIDTLLPKKLDETDDSYKSVQELNEVLSSAEKHKIRNVALTGPFGSGKSSVLVTLQEDFSKGRNYLPISLATLQANEEGDNISKSENKTSDEEKKIENLNRKIEYSILQQLIYREKAETVPNSRFRRIVHLSKKKLRRYSICVVLSLVCFLILFEPSFARVDSIYNFFSWGDTWNVVFDFVAVGWLLFMLFIVIRYVFRSYSNSKLNKLNLKDAEIEVVENNSIFNRHLDEILYFFQVTEYDVVIIEDLDRFGTPNIFLKLRELNQLINESKIVGRHITFVYAVKDDIFKDEERTKFFDYIITIIPVINPSNSKDKLKAALKANDCEDGISDDDLSEMAFFVQDMRILTNIVNEYRQYRDKLCTTNGAQLSKTKLLAMIVYKNYYPQDFALLHRRGGKIYQCLSSKRAFIKDALSKIEERKKDLESKKQIFLSNLHLSIKELRLLCLYKWSSNNIPQLGSIVIENNNYSLEQISDNDSLFEEILAMTSIQYRNYGSSNYYSPSTYNGGIKSFFNRNRYFEREQLLKAGDTPLKLLEKQIREDEIKIKSLRISEILRQYDLGETETYKNIGLSDMQDVFLRLGYIDEDYYDYISYFYPEMVSLEDREFLLKIKRQIKQPYDYHIYRINNVVKELKEYMFESDAILNIELLDYLATAKEYKDKFEHIMSRLERDMAPLAFLSQYYTEGKQCQKVFEHYIENTKAWNNIASWSNAEERENLIEAYLRYSTDLDDDAQNWLNCNYEFLTNHLSGITMDRALALIPNSCFVDLYEGSDDLLDCVIERGHYVIKLRNLTIITKHLNKGNITITDSTLNYTRIKDTGNDGFIAVVNNNIGEVIKVLQNTNKDDDTNGLLYILNSADIELNDKKQYLSGAVNHIDDFSGIINPALYDIAIEVKIVLPTWQNVLFYYDNCSDEIPEIFYDYINHYAEELARDTSTLFLKDRNDLYADLFGYNELSVENYEKLLPLFNGAFPEVELLADLDYTRLSVLIRQGRVAFDQESLAAINKTEALADYILWHPTYFMQHLDWKYDFAANSVQTILSSAKFSSDDKCKIIGVIPIAIIQDSKDIANSAIDILCNKKKINVADETLVCVVKSSTDTNKKIALTTNIVRSGIVNHALIRHLLDAIGEPYTEVGDKSKKPLLPNDALHQELLSALRQIKFISTSKPDKDGEKLRVYPTRTTYIF